MKNKSPILHYCITVKGKVQGVSYRFSAQAKAHEYHLTGLVKNLHNGDVYMECEGTEENINRLVEWCHTGPLLARVTEVIAEQGEVKGYETFEMKR
jgi:acylphosphatase